MEETAPFDQVKVKIKPWHNSTSHVPFHTEITEKAFHSNSRVEIGTFLILMSPSTVFLCLSLYNLQKSHLCPIALQVLKSMHSCQTTGNMRSSCRHLRSSVDSPERHSSHPFLNHQFASLSLLQPPGPEELSMMPHKTETNQTGSVIVD